MACPRNFVRREIGTNLINVGQIAQVRMKLHLLKQDNGSFTFRELLKGIYILYDGASTVGDLAIF